VRVRITSSARKHGINSGRIRAALANAVLHNVDGDYALYIGTDNRGVELEVGLVPDDRFADQYAAIHCMETRWRTK